MTSNACSGIYSGDFGSVEIKSIYYDEQNYVSVSHKDPKEFFLDHNDHYRMLRVVLGKKGDNNPEQEVRMVTVQLRNCEYMEKLNATAIIVDRNLSKARSPCGGVYLNNDLKPETIKKLEDLAISIIKGDTVSEEQIIDLLGFKANRLESLTRHLLPVYLNGDLLTTLNISTKYPPIIDTYSTWV